MFSHFLCHFLFDLCQNMMHHVSVLLLWQRTCEKQSKRKKSLSVIHGFQGSRPSWAGCVGFMPVAKQEHHGGRAGQAIRMGQDQGVTFKVTSPGTCSHLPGSHLPVVPSAMNWWRYDSPGPSTPTLLCWGACLQSTNLSKNTSSSVLLDF